MYRVLMDGLTIYNDRLENLKIFDPDVQVELNKTGSFTFTMYPDHPYYGLVRKMKSLITVYQDDYLLFRGRVFDDPSGFYNEKSVICEGELAFLLDSIQRPYSYDGTISGFLNLLVTRHNEQVEENKWFTVGNVTVTDANDYIVRSNIDHVDTWTELNDKLLKPLGGYIIVRHEGYINYLDYVAEINVLAAQKVAFGKNLLDLKRKGKSSEIGTALIPLGAKLKDADGRDTDERLTIASVNGGLDMLRDENAIAQFGTICKVETWDDVTEATNLMAKGQAYLSQLVKQADTVELRAADLAAAGEEITSFHLGTMVKVESSPHGIDQYLMVSKLEIKLLDPAANTMTLGGFIEGLGVAINGLADGQREIVRDVQGAVKQASEAVFNVERNVLSSFQQTAENITSQVAENYALKDDVDALVSSVSTEVSQTKDSFNIEFTRFSADLEAVAAGTDAEFEEIHKYIRFVDGNIIQGEEGSPFQKVQTPTRESYFESGDEVAYFSNHKLFVKDGQYTNSLQLGNFAFIPRENGNLSFKKL